MLYCMLIIVSSDINTNIYVSRHISAVFGYVTTRIRLIVQMCVRRKQKHSQKNSPGEIEGVVSESVEKMRVRSKTLR